MAQDSDLGPYQGIVRRPDGTVGEESLRVLVDAEGNERLVKPPIVAPSVSKDFGNRADGTPKGLGFFGVLKRPDGRVSTEISMGTQDVIPGQETEIPTMVPTLTPAELAFLLNHDLEQTPIPRSIARKAIDFARARLQEGKPFFAEAGEQLYHLYPQFKRTDIPTTGFSDATIRPIVMHRDTTRTR